MDIWKSVDKYGFIGTSRDILIFELSENPFYWVPNAFTFLLLCCRNTLAVLRNHRYLTVNGQTNKEEKKIKSITKDISYCFFFPLL